MKIIQICLILILMIGQLAAQSFQSVHNLGAEDEGVEVLELPSGNFLVAGAYSSSSDSYFPHYDNSFIAKLDTSGAILTSKTIPNFYPRAMFQVSDTIILVGGQFITSSGYIGIAIHKLDSAFNIIQSLDYNQNNHAILHRQSSINFAKTKITAVLPKILVSGGKVYSEFFQYNIAQNNYTSVVYDSLNFDMPTTSIQDSTKNLVFQNIGFGSSAYSGLVSLSNAGQVLSTKRFTTGLYSIFNADSIDFRAKVELKKYQGKYYFVGEIDNTNANTVLLPSSMSQDYAVVILDSNLNRISSTIIGSPDSADAAAYNGIVFKSNSLFLCGVKNWSYDDYYKPEASYIRISELNLNGGIIQERLYSTGDFLRINAMKGTKDGGFILVGSSYDSLGAHQNGLDLFIMKLDSLGNLTSINGKKIDEMNFLNFAIFPNPASGNINFQKVNQFEDYQIEIYDLSGKMINYYSWTNDLMNIDISAYRTGMYLYRIINKQGKIYQGKFLKD